MNEIADGKIHKIDDKWAYILLKISPYTNNDELEILKEQMLMQYSDYLLKFDSIDAMCYILCALKNNVMCELKHEFIFREPHISSMICGFSTLALKFPRALKDNLGEEET